MGLQRVRHDWATFTSPHFNGNTVMSSTYNVYYNCTTHTDLRRRENELQHPTTKFYSQKCSLSKLISFTHFPLLLTSSSLPEIFSVLISSTGWFDHPSLTEQVHTELRHVPGAESRFQSFYLVIKHTKYRMIHAIRRYLERASQVALVVKNLPANTGDHERHRFDPWVGKIPWSRKWQPIPIFLPGESHGQRSLLGYSPWGRRRPGHNWVSRESLKRGRERHMSRPLLELFLITSLKVRHWKGVLQNMGFSGQIKTEKASDGQDNSRERKTTSSSHCCVYSVPSTVQRSLPALIFLILIRTRWESLFLFLFWQLINRESKQLAKSHS